MLSATLGDDGRHNGAREHHCRTLVLASRRRMRPRPAVPIRSLALSRRRRAAPLPPRAGPAACRAEDERGGMQMRRRNACDAGPQVDGKIRRPARNRIRRLTNAKQKMRTEPRRTNDGTMRCPPPVGLLVPKKNRCPGTKCARRRTRKGRREDGKGPPPGRLVSRAGGKKAASPKSQKPHSNSKCKNASRH
jgi:hypothetical protein